MEAVVILSGGEGVVIPQLTGDFALYKIQYKAARAPSGHGIARARYKYGQACRMQGAGTLYGHSQYDLIPRGGAVLKVEKIDIAVHGGIYNLDKILFLFIGIKVHEPAGVFIPVDNYGLTRPAASRPVFAAAVGFIQSSGAAGPYVGAEALFYNIRRAVCAAGAEIIAPEGNHSPQGGIAAFKAYAARRYFAVVFANEIKACGVACGAAVRQ